ncbi:MAG: Cro/C1-type DNA-binding domain [Blastocatellia bacterium]
MKLKIREVAERMGIKNASQLRSATKLGVGTCYQLWEGTATRFDLDTLNTLCNALQVGPAMLFDYTPDVASSGGDATPSETRQGVRRSSSVRSGKGESRKARATARTRRTDAGTLR